MSDTIFTPVDAAARARIVERGLHETLFVEAGAGSGKTSALVARIVNLVTRDDVDLRSVAAITFTEAAAAELRERIRHELHVAADTRGNGRDPEVAARAQRALEVVDAAPISTLHSFAQRLLSEHPIEVGVPPRVEVLDEVQSTLAFEERWSATLDAWLDDPELEELVTRTTLLGIQLTSATRASLRDVAAILGDNWDRLETWVSRAADGAGDARAPLPPIDVKPLHEAIRRVLELPGLCLDESDLLLEHLDELCPELELLLHGDDPHRVLRLLADRDPKSGAWNKRKGRKDNWPDIEAVRTVLADADAAAEALRSSATQAVLDRWLHLLADFTLDAAHERTADGRLEFHDLLVLARRLLRRSPDARRALGERYTHLLLDEFQDTDPLQIELAVLLATTVDVPPGTPWSDLPVDDGRLFFVGDPKQSIYRFRRADIGLFLRARDRFAGADPLQLTQNFRTVPTVLDWVNHVFTQLMPDEQPGSQPRYQPLVAARGDHPLLDHRVTLLGGLHEDAPDAPELRRREAADVAACIRSIRDEPARWRIHRDGGWVDPSFGDITVLLPTRTSLPVLETALSDAGIPYRADTSSLVFDTPELRELLTVLRAVDDPADEIAIVAACRSPLFGCADTELFDFHHAGGLWDYRRETPDSLPQDHPVVVARAAMARWHDERLWVEPAVLLERIVAERDVFAVALGARRARDTWRRVRFLIDQARRFSEAGGGDLRAFLAWSELQRHESARVPEPLLPETDDDAVRIMTFHGAKGLEFPITILSGLTTGAARRRGGVQVLWGDDDVPEVSLNRNVASAQFHARCDIEEEMDEHEKQRLLYVGVTRARDHLVVSAHHKDTKDNLRSHAATLWQHSQAVLGKSCRVFEPPPSSDDVVATVAVPAPRGNGSAEAAQRELREMAEARASLLAGQSRRRVWSATAVAKAASAVVPDSMPDDTPDPAPDDEAVERAPGRRGRAGTAFGRAVHAVLQHAGPTIDVDTLTREARAAAVAEGIPGHVDEIVASARAALDAPVVRQAHAAARRWHELFVTAPVADGAILEGYVDLLADTPDGLLIIDYKTDRLSVDELDAAAAGYRLQAAAYALALESATGRPVASCTFVFALPDGAHERVVDDLHAAIDQVRSVVNAG